MIPRPVTIETLANGYLVHVGCQRLVFTDGAKMLNDLARYLDDPALVEQEYRNAYNISMPENLAETDVPMRLQP